MSTAWQYTTRGRLSTTIKQVSVPIPSAENDEIVVQIKAAALNPVENQIAQSSDLLLTRMMGAPPMGTPFVPCWDFTGVIHSVGAGVTDYKAGQEIFGVIQNVNGNGSLQKYVAMPASGPFTIKPASLSWEDAAALPLAYATMYTALIDYGRLAFNPHPADSGRRSVLILGGSSGTGTIGIQLAKKMGLNVVTTCSGRNIDLVKELGADEVIDYTKEDVAEGALHSKYAPYAVVIDCVGGKDLIPHLDHLILSDPVAHHLGIYITIVGDKTSRDAMGGAITNYFYPSQAIRQARGKLNDVLPTWLPGRSLISGKRYACIIMQPTKAMYDTVEAFMDSAKKVQIDSVFDFNDAPKAFEKIESGRARGKVVVRVN